jgi:hypothetical protein
MLRKLVPLVGQPQPLVANRRRREVTALFGIALESLGIDFNGGASAGVPCSGPNG